MTFTESCIAAAVVSTLMAISMPSLIRAKETYTLESAAHDAQMAPDGARSDMDAWFPAVN